MFGAPEYASGSFNHERHLHSLVIIVKKAKEKLNLFVNTYPLLEGKLILRMTFEPQGEHDSGIQPSHQYHGRNYNDCPQQNKRFLQPSFMHPQTGIVL